MVVQSLHCRRGQPTAIPQHEVRQTLAVDGDGLNDGIPETLAARQTHSAHARTGGDQRTHCDVSGPFTVRQVQNMKSASMINQYLHGLTVDPVISGQIQTLDPAPVLIDGVSHRPTRATEQEQAGHRHMSEHVGEEDVLLGQGQQVHLLVVSVPQDLLQGAFRSIAAADYLRVSFANGWQSHADR